MSEPDKPIRISGRQAAEWGPFTSKLASDTIQHAIEEKTGKPHEWRQLINMDAIELVPVGEKPQRVDPKAFARIDLFDGHTLCQFLPGARDQLIRELLNLVDGLRTHGRVPFIQAVEVEEVKA